MSEIGGTRTIHGQSQMTKDQFLHVRNQLQKTQRQLAALLGSSLNAVHSYEQGWRSIPGHIERQMLFLASRKSGSKGAKPCWMVKKCPPERKTRCPAWEFQAGTFCWFINGTICEGIIQRNWNEKMELCRSCEVFQKIIRELSFECLETGSGCGEKNMYGQNAPPLADSVGG